MGTSGTRAEPTTTGLTARQQKWFASVQASLERDTGKTLDDWVAIARTCPETRPKARADWLREHHGLGVNRAGLGAVMISRPSRRHPCRNGENSSASHSISPPTASRSRRTKSSTGPRSMGSAM